MVATKHKFGYLRACANAYCPTLPAPKPSVCGHVDDVPADERQWQAWSELRDAMLATGE